MISSNVLDETVTVACVISDCIGQAKLITKICLVVTWSWQGLIFRQHVNIEVSNKRDFFRFVYIFSARSATSGKNSETLHFHDDR